MAQPPKPGQPNPPVERSETLIEAGANIPPRPPGKPEPEERAGTVLETEDDIRRALSAGHKQRQPAPPLAIDPSLSPAPSSPTSAAARPAVPFRPTVRPPLAVLTVFDDGKTDGEVIRIRDQRFLIGRAEGDLRIPFDNRISARHLEITHQVVGGLHRWVVTDLQSMHGMYVRVSRTVLADKAEFLVGNGRYRFDAPHTDAGATADQLAKESGFGETHGWDERASPFRPAAVTELIGSEIGNRMLLIKNEYWIGSDPSCPICRPDDPFCEPKHVRLYRGGARGGWHAEHHKTHNGLWLRMPQITVETVAQFQIGEQRFQLRVK
jgi:FHA domain